MCKLFVSLSGRLRYANSKVVAWVFAVLIFTGQVLTVSAEFSADEHLSRDDHVGLDIDPSTFNEFKRLYEAGYPPASIMLHAVSLGMAIDDILYLAVKADSGRSQELFSTATALLPSLPGWACRTANVMDRYSDYLSPEHFGTQSTVSAVAREWFENGRQLAPFPDWYRLRIVMPGPRYCVLRHSHHDLISVSV